MFITPERVMRLTGYENITLQDVAIAQGMLESYTGRMEARITDADDLELMAKATAYQCVYLKADTNHIFEQARVDSIQQDSSAVNYKPGDFDSPFIAPYALMAMKNLSWKRSHSIGFGRGKNARGRRVYDWKRD